VCNLDSGQTAAALTIYRYAGNVDGKLRCQNTHAAQRESLFTNLIYRTVYNILDQCRIEINPADNLVEHDTQKLRRHPVPEISLPLAYRRSHCTDNEYIIHQLSPLCILREYAYNLINKAFSPN
jgi:hypothetical protein